MPFFIFWGSNEKGKIRTQKREVEEELYKYIALIDKRLFYVKLCKSNVFENSLNDKTNAFNDLEPLIRRLDF